MSIINPVQINAHEDIKTEFKTSLFFQAGISVLSADQIDVITSTLASLMNQEGGTLYIGVNDKGYATNPVVDELQYLNSCPAYKGNTYPSNLDGYKRFILDWVSKNLGNFPATLLSFEFPQYGTVTVCKIDVKKSKVPVWFKGSALYVRADASTRQLKGNDITSQILQIDKKDLISAQNDESAAFAKRVADIKVKEPKLDRILVVYPNGDFIHEKTNVDTMLEVIHRANIDEVLKLGLTGRAGRGKTPYVPFIWDKVYIDNPQYPTKTQRSLDGYMVFTKYSAGDIVSKLTQISNGLGLNLYIEIY